MHVEFALIVWLLLIRWNIVCSRRSYICIFDRDGKYVKAHITVFRKLLMFNGSAQNTLNLIFSEHASIATAKQNPLHVLFAQPLPPSI